MIRIFKEIKWFFQKIFLGYNETEFWNLDCVFAKYILKRLKAFKKYDRQGYPARLKSFEDWNEILDKMIWSFNYVNQDFGMDESFEGYDEIYPKLDKPEIVTELRGRIIYHDRGYNIEKDKFYREKYKEGMKLFSEYFGNLWD